MSTTLLIVRCPAAARRAFSHGGEGAIVTSSNTRAVNREHRSGHSTRTSAPATGPVEPGSSLQGASASDAPVAACSSRATPYTPRQSGRLGVISSSITSVEMGSTSSSGVPGASSASSVRPSRTRIPSLPEPSSSSVSEQIMPSEATPLSLRFSIFIPPGMTAPGSATATVWPAATLGAPHTMLAGSSPPTSTVHALSLSASGCFSALSTRPTTNPSVDATPWWWIASTFVPLIVSRSSIARTSRSGSQYSRSQGSGTLIRTAPGISSRFRSRGAGREFHA